MCREETEGCRSGSKLISYKSIDCGSLHAESAEKPQKENIVVEPKVHLALHKSACGVRRLLKLD